MPGEKRFSESGFCPAMLSSASESHPSKTPEPMEPPISDPSVTDVSEGQAANTLSWSVSL